MTECEVLASLSSFDAYFIECCVTKPKLAYIDYSVLHTLIPSHNIH